MEKEVIRMILFVILLVIFLILAAIVVLGIGIGGALFIVVFGDVIVCMLILLWLMRKLFRRKR